MHPKKPKAEQCIVFMKLCNHVLFRKKKKEKYKKPLYIKESFSLNSATTTEQQA